MRVDVSAHKVICDTCGSTIQALTEGTHAVGSTYVIETYDERTPPRVVGLRVRIVRERSEDEAGNLDICDECITKRMERVR